MSDRPAMPEESLPLSLVLRIDALCQSFEAAWQKAHASGPRPRIEDYLAAAEVAEPWPMLLELLKVELHYRQKEGPSADEYLRRFAEHAHHLGPLLDQLLPAAGDRAEVASGAGAGDLLESTGPELLEERPQRLWKPTDGSLPYIPGYEVLGVLGRGAMGVVYQARHIQLKRLVALKMILAGSHAGEQELARFRTEAEAVARVQHPNIVQVYEVGEHGGLPYFSLEFVDGGTLRAKVAGTPQHPAEAARLVHTLARAMHVAHQRGILHRDLKPANVLLTADGIPKVSDFGLAKRLGADAGQTHTGQVMGTPSYMAPEQAAGRVRELDPRTDVYALGAILYEMLTGHPPFKGATVLETLEQVRSQEPVPPRQLQPKVPVDLECICLRCLHKEPAKRYSTAAHLADDLHRFHAGVPIWARPVSGAERLRKWVRRRPALAALLTALVLVIGVALGLVTWKWREAMEANASKDQTLERMNEEMGHGNVLAAQATLERPGGVAVAEDQLSQCPEVTRRTWEWQHLHGACRGGLFTLYGHTGWVTSVSWSPDGKRLASASDDGTVRVWETETGQEIRTLPGHTLGVDSVSWSPDGKRLVSASDDGTVKVWDTASGQEVVALKVGTSVIKGGISLTRIGGTIVSWSPDSKHLASAGMEDQQVRLWNAERGQEVSSLQGHTGWVTSVSWSPDSKRLASASEDRTVRLWDAERGQEILNLRGHTDTVFSVSWSPDGKHLASAGMDRTVRVWDAECSKEVLCLKGHIGIVTSVSWSPDGKRLASASEDQTVRLWDAERGQETLTLRGHTDTVRSVSWSPDGKHLASASNDRTVRVWDTESGKEIRALRGHTQAVTSVSWSPAGKHLASASREDRTVRVWDTESGKETRVLHGRTSVSWSPDGKRLATAGQDQTVRVWERVWDAERGQVVSSSLQHSAGVTSVVFSPDGKRWASASFDKKGFVWDPEAKYTLGMEVRRGLPIVVLAGHTGVVTSVSWSPDGKRLATAGQDQTVRVWDAERGPEVLTLKGRHSFNVTSVSWSTEGKCLFSTDVFGNSEVWDLHPDQLAHSAELPPPPSERSALSPDGRHRAIGGDTVIYVVETQLSDAEHARRRAHLLPDPGWHAWQAWDSAQHGQWFAVVFHLDRRLALRPDDMEAHIQRGRAHAEMGHWSEAVADFLWIAVRK